jgi:arabinan endo-1,5-alpha-L-arabinosidase
MSIGPDRSRGAFANPVEGVVLGDPFVLRHRGAFYLYGTNDGPPLPDGRVIPVFRSQDLIRWEPLGGALEPQDPAAEHWAPEVLAWNGRIWMVVSFGDVEHRGHALWVAVADRPEGPFRLAGQISDPSERFSIDGSWLLDDDGRLYLFRCLDFVAQDDPPHGTGIVVQPMRDPLTPSGPPQVVLRAHSPWQVFEYERIMPLYEGRRFATWTTIEGPAPVKRNGRYFCGYSGGNYTGAYGTGEAVADSPLGPYADLRGREGPLFGTVPGLVEGPGHFSVVRPDLVHDWIVLHGRRPGEPGRRVWLCPASWGTDGVTIGELTDRPQPAPPLPSDVICFRDPAGSRPSGWRFETDGSGWRTDGESLRHEPGAASGAFAVAWLEGVSLSGDWVLEVYLRFPDGAIGPAGFAIRSGGGLGRVLIDPVAMRCVASAGDREVGSRPLPTLGDEPFEPGRFHSLEVRNRDGRAEVRVDGIRLLDDLEIAPRLAEFGLTAAGTAAFDAVAIAGEK